MKVDLIFIAGSGVEAGKDTVADILAAHINMSNNLDGITRHCFKCRFAFKLKQIASILTGEKMVFERNVNYANTIQDFTHDQKKMGLPIWGKTMRVFLQTFATETCRDNFDEDIWVKGMAETILYDIFQLQERTFSGAHHIVVMIPDWRFTNEKKLPGYLHFQDSELEITSKFIYVDRQSDKEKSDHISEHSIDPDQPYITKIDNTGTLDDLDIKCYEYLKRNAIV
jgi:hypothetical protein